MKKIALFMAALLLGTSSYAADNQSNGSSAGKLGALGAVFKKQSNNTLKTSENRVNMVYGGQDVSRMPTLAMHTVI